MGENNDFAIGYAMGQDNSNSGGGFGLGGDGWGGLLGLIVVASLFGWGGMGGFGGWGMGGAGLQGMATRADINEGFALNNITGGITAIQQGICDSTYALNNAISGGFNATQMGMMQGFNGVERGFCDLSHQLSDCCCQTQRAIDGVNYNLATQTNALQTAMCTNTRDLIDNQNANHRMMMDFLVQEKLSAKDALIAQLQQNNALADLYARIDAKIEASTAETIRRTGHDYPIACYPVQPPIPLQFPTNGNGQVQWNNQQNCGPCYN